MSDICRYRAAGAAKKWRFGQVSSLQETNKQKKEQGKIELLSIQWTMGEKSAQICHKIEVPLERGVGVGGT